jgi:phosphatidylglycerophosphate synthase
MNRRPLKSRKSAVMHRVASWMAAAGVSPNAISIGSVVFAAIGAMLIVAGGQIGWVLGAVCCQLRLACNLLDGLVAVEGGKGGADGAFWNEVPDRVSDILLLGAAGVAAGLPWLGAAAAAGALMTAYVREFGRAEGLHADYRGPMGKPQRMAALTIALLIAVVEPRAIALGLWVILAGSAVTVARRGTAIVVALRERR